MTRRRIGITLAAALGSLGVVLAAAPVGADPGGHGHGGGGHGWGRDGGEGRGYDRAEHGPPPGRGWRRGEDGGGGWQPPEDRRYHDRRYDGRDDFPPDRGCGDFAPCGYARPRYAPSYPPGPSRAWRRGEFLPQPYWSGGVDDPRRHRLRAPPPGYAWYGVGRDAYLVQRSTGLILDTAPGAW